MSWPADAEVEWKVLGEVDIAAPEMRDGFATITASLPVAELAEIPNDAPVRFRLPPMLQAGTFDGWREASAVMAPLYRTAGTIAPDRPVAEQVARIKAAHGSELERAVAALRMVQDEVAYQLNGRDGGNYNPQNPAQTWEIRYGDCQGQDLAATRHAARHGDRK